MHSFFFLLVYKTVESFQTNRGKQLAKARHRHSVEQVPDYTCNVWPCIVLLQSDVLLMSLYEGNHMTLNNFTLRAYAGEIYIDNL